MSLLYDADGDVFVATSNISVPTAGTIVMWVYLTSDTVEQALCAYVGDGVGTSYLDLVWRADVAGDNFEAYRHRATSDITAQAAAASFSVYALNKWLCLVFRWDAGGVAADQSVWMGDELTQPAAPSSYVAQSAGSGTAGTTAGAVYIGKSVGPSAWVRGRVGFHALFPTRLSDADVERVWRGYFIGNPTVWWVPGANGTTDVPERAAGNLGVITALSSPDFEPRRVFPTPWWAYHQMQAQG